MRKFELLLVTWLLVVCPRPLPADPVAKPWGNRPPPVLNLETNTPLVGPLAPATAREWLAAVASNFDWNVAAAKVMVSARDYVEIKLEGGDVHTARLRVYRGTRPMIALAMSGICCCGSCVGGIHFFRVVEGKLHDVTDSVWPRFPFVVSRDLLDDRVDFQLGRSGRRIVIARHGLQNSREYVLKFDDKMERFRVLWKDKDNSPPYEATP